MPITTVAKHWVNYVEDISTAHATIIIILTAICFGLVPWFAKELLDSGIASPAIAFYRYILTAILFFPVLRFTNALKKECYWAIFSGACVGLGWVGYVEALKVVPVSSVSVIYMTYPLVTLVASWALIGNVPNKQSIFAGFLILIAAVISFMPNTLSSSAMKALLVAFSAPIAFGLAIAILTDKLHNLSPIQRLAGFSAGASLGLLPLLINLEYDQVIPADPALWSHIIALALATALIPQYLYTTLAPLIGPAKSAMAGSFELPTMFLVGFLIFNESIGTIQILSGVLVLMAILITPAISSNRRVTKFEAGS